MRRTPRRTLNYGCSWFHNAAKLRPSRYSASSEAPGQVSLQRMSEFMYTRKYRHRPCLCSDTPAEKVLKDPKTSLPVLLIVAGAAAALLWWKNRGTNGGTGSKGDTSSRSRFAFPGGKVRACCVGLLLGYSQTSTCFASNAKRVLCNESRCENVVNDVPHPCSNMCREHQKIA